MSNVIYEKVIYENPDKGFQLRLVLNNFRDVEYLHIRKYFMSYDEGYLPSKEGVSLPANIESIFSLLDGLVEICSLEENKHVVVEYLNKLISTLKDEQNPRIFEPSVT